MFFKLDSPPDFIPVFCCLSLFFAGELGGSIVCERKEWKLCFDIRDVSFPHEQTLVIVVGVIRFAHFFFH